MQRERPVAYLSKALGPTHQQLSIYEKEFLALIMAVEKWRSQELVLFDRTESPIRFTEKSYDSADGFAFQGGI